MSHKVLFFGPLLFLIYINDIIEDINSFIRLFAEGTSLYVIVENPFVSAEILNSDIAKVHSWATKWLVTFDPLKTEEMIFSRKLKKPQHPLQVVASTGRQIILTEVCNF